MAKSTSLEREFEDYKSGFKPFSHRIMDFHGAERRQETRRKLLGFGNEFLDRALRGVFPDDFVLVGAEAGCGKTQFAKNCAQVNSQMGKRVHFFALEAYEGEIEDRTLFDMLSFVYKRQQVRPAIDRPLNFADWRLGYFDDVLGPFESQVRSILNEKMSGFHTFYKSSTFTVKELVMEASAIFDQSDLIIIDHAHYFDFTDDSDQKSLKHIAKTCRDITQIYGVPIMLVAHLRRRDKSSKELAPGLDEFHGSSELGKIATRAITFGAGAMIDAGTFETFVRVPKDRLDGSLKRYIGRLKYIPEIGSYDPNFQIGKVGKDGDFQQLLPFEEPYWVKSKLKFKEEK